MATRSLGQLTIDFIARTAGFEEGVNRASRITQQETRKIQRNVSIAAGAITAFASSFQAMAVSVFNSTASVVDSTAKMARQVGLTTEALTSMRFATQEFVNISDGNFDLSLRRMTRRVSEAAEGSGAAKKALDGLGISAKELSNLSPDQQFYRIADAMKNIGDRGTQLRYTMAIFDTQGMPLVDALNQGGDALREMADQADRFGAVIKDVDAAAMESAVASISRMQSTFSGLKNEIAFAMAPIMQDMAESVTGFVQSLEIDADTIRSIFAGISTAATGAASVVAMQAIPVMIKSLKALRVAMMALPIGWIATTITVATTAMLAFSGNITASVESLAGLKALINLTLDAIRSFGQAISTALGGSDKAWIDLGNSVDSVISGVLGGLDSFINGFVGGFRALEAGLNAYFHNFEAGFINSFRDILRTAYSFIDDLTGALSNVPFMEGLATNLAETQVEGVIAGKNILDEMRKAWDETSVSTMQAAYETEKILVLYEQFINTPAPEAAKKLADELGDGGGGGGVSKNAKKAADEIKGLVDRLFPAIKGMDDLAKNTKLLSQAHARGLVDADQYTRGMALLKKEYEETIIQSQDHLKQLSQEVDAVESANKSLAERIRTHGENDLSLARSALAETQARIATLENIKAIEQATGAKASYIQELDVEISKLKELENAYSHNVGLLDKQAAKESVDSLAEESEQFSKDLEGWLIGAFDRSFDRGESLIGTLTSTLKNQFSNLILRPIVQPVAAGMAGMFGVSGAANAATGSGGGLFSNFSPLTGFSNSFSGTVQTVGESLTKLGGKMGDFGANLVMNSDTIGSALDKLGAGFSYGTAVFKMAQGEWGSGLGTAAGQLIAGPVGAIIGGQLGSMLDNMFKGETRSGGGFVYDPSANATRFAGGPSGGYGGQATINAVNDLFKGAADTLEGVFKGIGSDITTAFFHGAFESSEKGRGGVFSGGGLIIDGQQVGFGGSKKGDGVGGRSGTAEEMFAFLQQDVYYSVLEGWQAAGDQLPTILRNVLDGVNVRSLSEEMAQEMVGAISATVAQVNDLQAALNDLPFSNLKGLSFELAGSLLELSGGMENLLSNIGGYYQNFFTDAERFDIGVKRLSADLKDVGVTLPRTANEFRGVVEALDLTTVAGQAVWVALMNASDAANDYYMAIEAATNGIVSSIGSLYERITLDIMEGDEQRYNYYKNQFETFSEQLDFAQDAQQINDLVKRMTEAASNAYNLLDEEARRGGKGQEYLDMLGEMQRVADDRLEAAYRQSVDEQSRAITSSLVASLDQSGANMAHSASQIGAWANGVESRLRDAGSQVAALARAVSAIGSGSEVTN